MISTQDIVDYHTTPVEPARIAAQAEVGFLLYNHIVPLPRSRSTSCGDSPETSSRLVTGGVYRYTRNPMYLGMLLALAGWAVALSHLSAPLWLMGYAAYMNRFQILPEERALMERFGAVFGGYRLRGEPLTSYACHCTECQAATGAAFSLSLIVPREALEVIGGEPVATTYSMGGSHRWRDSLGLRGCGFFHVVDGLIRFQRGYWDRLSFLRQHGLPLPPE